MRDRPHDYVIVGSGIAGLFAAALAAEHGRVAIVTKGTVAQTNTRWAQGGIAAAVAAEDSAALHERDTLIAGAGLCDPAAVHVLCAEGPARVRDLIHFGVGFDTVDGVISLAMEGAHSMPRVLHARGDATGAEIEHALSRRIAHAEAEVYGHTLLLDLIVENGSCTGCTVLDLKSGERRRIEALHTVLATGGGGRLFAHTTNPAVATADGVAVALRAGAQVADLEFFQFHPTALLKAGAPRFLISEATRGDGAHLINTQGERFMPRYDERGELAPRDVVARAILSELSATSSPHVWLDLTHLDPSRVEAHFPNISRVCRRYGIEITREPIPVAPAAHYMIGGIRTDVWGRTSMPGLYACGEAASTGVHGANRLASNSLLEAVVFARRIVDASNGSSAAGSWPRYDQPQSARAPGRHRVSSTGSASGSTRESETGARSEVVVEPAPPFDLISLPPPPPSDRSAVTSPQFRGLMWREVSIARSGAGLSAAADCLQGWAGRRGIRPTRPAVELANMVLVGWLMVRAALAREESRGAHYRADFAESRPEWRRRLAWQFNSPQPLELG